MEIEEVAKLAKEVLVSNKGHSPQLVIEDDKGNINIVVMQFETEIKQMAIKGIRELIYKFNSKRYFVIMEAWMSKINKGEKLYRTPRHDVDRSEILIISEYRKDMKNKQLGFPFHKEKEEIVFDEPMPELKETASTWNAFIEMEGVQERFNQDIKEINDAFLKKMSNDIAKKYSKLYFAAKSDKERKEVLFNMIEEGEQIFDAQKATIIKDKKFD